MNTERIVCPVDRTLNLISKKWSIQISNCLKELEENGLIEKKVLNTTPVTTEYYLTEYGKSMNRIVYELAMFTLNDDNDNSYSEETKNELKNNFKHTLKIDD